MQYIINILSSKPGVLFLVVVGSLLSFLLCYWMYMRDLNKNEIKEDKK